MSPEMWKHAEKAGGRGPNAKAQWLFDSPRQGAANGPFPLPPFPVVPEISFALVFPLTLTPLWDFLRSACCSVPGPPVSLCHQSCPRRTTYWGSCNTVLQSTAPWDSLGLSGCPERLWGLLLGDLLWMSLPSPTALGFPSRVRAGVRLFWALGRFKPGPTALLQGVCSARHRTGAVSQ